MSFVKPVANDPINAQDADLIRDALTASAGMVGNQWLGLPTAPAVANGAAGALTGTYHYGVTFVVTRQGVPATILGETMVSLSSAAVTPAAQQVNLTAIPVSTNAECNARRLYRTVAGGTQLLFLAQISDNVTTAYTDNAGDGTLGANAPVQDSADGSLFGAQQHAYRLAFQPL